MAIIEHYKKHTGQLCVEGNRVVNNYGGPSIKTKIGIWTCKTSSNNIFKSRYKNGTYHGVRSDVLTDNQGFIWTAARYFCLNSKAYGENVCQTRSTKREPETPRLFYAEQLYDVYSDSPFSFIYDYSLFF